MRFSEIMLCHVNVEARVTIMFCVNFEHDAYADER